MIAIEWQRLKNVIDAIRVCAWIGPSLHHATYGQCNALISDAVWQWANNQENGASVKTKNAL
jgi:hypothetical protein